jgi:hypothetical protein
MCPLARIRVLHVLWTNSLANFKIKAGVGILFYSSAGVLQEGRANGELWWNGKVASFSNPATVITLVYRLAIRWGLDRLAPITVSPPTTVPTEVVITTARPDIVLLDSKSVTLLELTVPWNSAASLASAQLRKQNKPLYQLLASNLDTQGYAEDPHNLDWMPGTFHQWCFCHPEDHRPPSSPRQLRSTLMEAAKAAIAGSYYIFAARNSPMWQHTIPGHNYVLFGYSVWIVISCVYQYLCNFIAIILHVPCLLSCFVVRLHRTFSALPGHPHLPQNYILCEMALLSPQVWGLFL